MINETFEIRFRKWYDNRTYRATVEITYHTENVIRFTIKAGVKTMWMEKHLFKKTGQWKISRMDFEMKNNSKENAALIMNIQDAIDFHIKKMFP